MKGNINEALDLHFKLFTLNSKVSGTGGVSSVKAAATLAGFFGGEPRKPLKPLSEQNIAEMKNYFKENNLI